jgi:hypothetical protein
VVPALALLAGAVIGIALQAEPAPAPQPSAAPEDPAPIIVTGIREEGGAVRLTWIDPTNGEALFIVSQMTDAGARPLRDVPAGQTEIVLTGLDPAATQYCFVVIAVQGSQTSASSVMCTPVRASASTSP